MNGPNTRGSLAIDFQPPGPPLCSVHSCQGPVHVKKTIEKLKQQAGTGMRVFGKKSKKDEDSGKPGKTLPYFLSLYGFSPRPGVA